MSRKSHWLWKVYLLFLIFGTVKKAVYMFHPKSHITFYFMVLRNMDSYFYFDYIVNVLQVGINIFQCIPVFLFIYQYRPRHIHNWRILFVFKVALDIFGNSFKIQQFYAMYYYNPRMCVTYIISTISLYVPAMLIWYLYAFHTEKVMPKDAKLTPKFL